MKETVMRLPWVLAPLLLMAGCVSVQRATKVAPAGVVIQGTAGTPAEHVHVSNYGYYLFNCVPLFCGNTVSGNRGETVWFSNEVTLPKTQGVMVEQARARNCQMAELQPQVRSTCFFSSIPYIGNTLGLLWYKEVQMSAVLVSPDAKGGAR